MYRPGPASSSRRAPLPAWLVWSFVVAIAGFLGSGLFAQEQSASPQSADGAGQSPRSGGRTQFRTGVDVVTLNVTVADTRDKFVGGLKSGDFAVYEDGVQQDLAFFEASEVPLDLALLLDVSASMEQKLPFVRKAATGFANALRPGDRASVVTFNNRISVAQVFTT
jgi:Ca-activated chloride channel family protein